jgi:hypothetical protein
LCTGNGRKLDGTLFSNKIKRHLSSLLGMEIDLGRLYCSGKNSGSGAEFLYSVQA